MCECMCVCVLTMYKIEALDMHVRISRLHTAEFRLVEVGGVVPSVHVV